MGISIINDKTPVILSYYIYNWNPYIGKTASLYCNSHLVMSTHNIDEEKKKKRWWKKHMSLSSMRKYSNNLHHVQKWEKMQKIIWCFPKVIQGIKG